MDMSPLPTGDSLLLTTKFPGASHTTLIEDEKLSRTFNHLVVSNPGPWIGNLES